MKTMGLNVLQDLYKQAWYVGCLISLQPKVDGSVLNFLLIHSAISIYVWLIWLYREFQINTFFPFYDNCHVHSLRLPKRQFQPHSVVLQNVCFNFVDFIDVHDVSCIEYTEIKVRLVKYSSLTLHATLALFCWWRQTKQTMITFSPIIPWCVRLGMQQSLNKLLRNRLYYNYLWRVCHLLILNLLYRLYQNILVPKACHFHWFKRQFRVTFLYIQIVKDLVHEATAFHSKVT